MSEAEPVKVMVVEEHASLRAMIRSVLELGDAEILEASSVADALWQYGAYRPEWILLDLDLNGGGAMEAAERFSVEHPEARVILMAEADSLTLRHKARRAGVRGVLVKETLYDDLQRTGFLLHENIGQDVAG